MRALSSLVVVPLVLALPACTTQRAYDTAQAYQRNQCGRIPDKAEFDRCMSGANSPYDAYKRKTDPEKK
jgi:hypothetical protein